MIWYAVVLYYLVRGAMEYGLVVCGLLCGMLVVRSMVVSSVDE